MTEKSFFIALKEYNESLTKIISLLESRLKRSPAGSLKYVNKEHGITQYYLIGEKGKKPVYIRKKERQKASAVAQRDYDKRLLKRTLSVTESLKILMDNMAENSLESCLSTFPEERQRLIEPVVKPDTNFVVDWQSVEYEKKPFSDNAPNYYTARGERVRSKSEVMIADTLFKMNIPYRYEYPLIISGVTFHPDFTVLNVRDRKEYYWEHFGMLDDMTYRDETLKKMEIYENAGIVPGKKLIMTFETLHAPLSYSSVQKRILEFLQ